MSVLVFLLVAMLAFLAGHLLGSRQALQVPAAHVPAPSVSTALPAVPEPAPVLVKPKIVPVLEKEVPEKDSRKTPPQTTAASAEAALRAFLDAPDWARRAAHVLDAARVRPLMEEYAAAHGEAATPYQSISLRNSQTDPDTGTTLFLFNVTTEKIPGGFPVAVHEATDGWQVDWETFIEFHDDLFKKFVTGPAGKSARFHLFVSQPPPERAAATDNDFFSSYLLKPPMPDRGELAYVRKESDIHVRLESAFQKLTIATPVIEVAKRQTNDGKTYLEIVNIIAEDWMPTSGR